MGWNSWKSVNCKSLEIIKWLQKDFRHIVEHVRKSLGKYITCLSYKKWPSLSRKLVITRSRATKPKQLEHWKKEEIDFKGTKCFRETLKDTELI